MNAIGSVGQSLLHAVRAYPQPPAMDRPAEQLPRWTVEQRLAAAAIQGTAHAVALHHENQRQLLDVFA